MQYHVASTYFNSVNEEYYDTLIDTIHTLASMGNLEQAEILAKELKGATHWVSSSAERASAF